MGFLLDIHEFSDASWKPEVCGLVLVRYVDDINPGSQGDLPIHPPSPSPTRAARPAPLSVCSTSSSPLQPAPYMPVMLAHWGPEDHPALPRCSAMPPPQPSLLTRFVTELMKYPIAFAIDLDAVI